MTEISLNNEIHQSNKTVELKLVDEKSKKKEFTETEILELKKRLNNHFSELGYKTDTKKETVLTIDNYDKDSIRKLHAYQKNERLKKNAPLIKKYSQEYLKFFASGKDISPEKIQPIIKKVESNTFESNIFRLASLTWSVPVSQGFGRRIRYLVWDKYHNKLIGIIAIGDPVYNLSVRDKLIGWDSDGKKKRLVNIMDAYVLGALPPYNMLLCGKMIACFLRSQDIYKDFEEKYSNSEGIISKKKKNPHLLAVTTSSSMGRSSVYNRLKLNGTIYMHPIEYTKGWGHFHIPDELFNDLRDFLRIKKHSYADGHKFGQGANWKFRLTKTALNKLGMGSIALKHGIKRQVFISYLAENSKTILKNGIGEPDLSALLSINEISQLALDRWIIKRAERMPDYKKWTTKNLLDFWQN